MPSTFSILGLQYLITKGCSVQNTLDLVNFWAPILNHQSVFCIEHLLCMHLVSIVHVCVFGVASSINILSSFGFEMFLIYTLSWHRTTYMLPFEIILLHFTFSLKYHLIFKPFPVCLYIVILTLILLALMQFPSF